MQNYFMTLLIVENLNQNFRRKNMHNKYIKEIRKALTEIVGLNKLG